MMKPLFASAAAFALMTGLALAQGQHSTTQQTTDADGNQTTAKKSFSKTDDANGSQMSRSRQEQTNSPDGSATTSQQTTTTKSPN